MQHILIKIAIPVVVGIIIISAISGTDSGTNLACTGTGGCFTGTITRIVDGDTLDVDNQRIRLVLIDAPENNQPGFDEATNVVKRICRMGEEAVVDQDGMQMYDNYDRMVAKVSCDGKLVNEELLKSGHATIMEFFCDKSEFSGEDWVQNYGC